ncbi:hypothetical protein H9P43_004876 [Blastocladiella emersonii ATCC 22665]|nr:hypothetical protein H9P43_004876 [Blastocladiella emersonii ATCC 22665]
MSPSSSSSAYQPSSPTSTVASPSSALTSPTDLPSAVRLLRELEPIVPSSYPGALGGVPSPLASPVSPVHPHHHHHSATSSPTSGAPPPSFGGFGGTAGGAGHHHRAAFASTITFSPAGPRHRRRVVDELDNPAGATAVRRAASVSDAKTRTVTGNPRHSSLAPLLIPRYPAAPAAPGATDTEGTETELDLETDIESALSTNSSSLTQAAVRRNSSLSGPPAVPPLPPYRPQSPPTAMLLAKDRTGAATPSPPRFCCDPEDEEVPVHSDDGNDTDVEDMYDDWDGTDFDEGFDRGASPSPSAARAPSTIDSAHASPPPSLPPLLAASAEGSPTRPRPYRSRPARRAVVISPHPPIIIGTADDEYDRDAVNPGRMTYRDVADLLELRSLMRRQHAMAHAILVQPDVPAVLAAAAAALVGPGLGPATGITSHQVCGCGDLVTVIALGGGGDADTEPDSEAEAVPVPRGCDRRPSKTATASRLHRHALGNHRHGQEKPRGGLGLVHHHHLHPHLPHVPSLDAIEAHDAAVARAKAPTAMVFCGSDEVEEEA